MSTLVPIEGGVDFPDTAVDQLPWLTEAGLNATIIFAEADLAILRADQSEPAFDGQERVASNVV